MSGRVLKPRIRCAVYTRQSVRREPGEDLSSCDAQREHCAMFIESQKFEGWELLRARFDDLGQSGATLERPALQRLLRACVDGQIDRLVVWKLDRLTRKLEDWARLAEFFEQVGVEITLAGQALEGAGLSVTHFVQHVLASFAEYERELIGERLRDARAGRRALGLRASGRVPFGYEVDEATRQLVPDAAESVVVREMFERAAHGSSATEIARWLNDAGHTTRGTSRRAGGPWSGRTVLQLLRNPVYLGKRRVGDQLIAAAHPAIVESKLAERSDLAIGARRTSDNRPRQRLLASQDDPYMLRGILRCGGCGRAMTTSASKPVSLKRPNAHPRYYRCRGTAMAAACKPPVQVPAQKTETSVIAMLRDPHVIAVQSPHVAALVKALRPRWRSMPRSQQTEWLRRVLWSVEWKPKSERLNLLFDEIGIEQLLEDEPLQLEAGLPVIPARDEAGPRKKRSRS